MLVVRSVLRVRLASPRRALSALPEWSLNDPTLVPAVPAGAPSFTVRDPASGAEVARVAAHSAADAAAAVDLAVDAQAAWRAAGPGARAGALRAWHAGLVANADDLATLMTLESGKPLAEARGEVRRRFARVSCTRAGIRSFLSFVLVSRGFRARAPELMRRSLLFLAFAQVAYGASFVEWFAEEARRATGSVMCAPPGKRMVSVRQPVGACALIAPWNFPLAMITRKAAPALAAGCVAVVKPAELTPLTALAAVELAARAGVPRGALGIVTAADRAGSEAVGAAWCDDARVRKLSFTGSTRVGKALARACAPTMKRVSLELGGNAPFVVFEDADLDVAVRAAMASKFRNAGQVRVDGVGGGREGI